MICGKFYDFCEILQDNCAQKTRKRQLKAQKSAYKRGMWQPPEVNILMLHAAGFPESRAGLRVRQRDCEDNTALLNRKSNSCLRSPHRWNLRGPQLHDK